MKGVIVPTPVIYCEVSPSWLAMLRTCMCSTYMSDPVSFLVYRDQNCGKIPKSPRSKVTYFEAALLAMIAHFTIHNVILLSDASTMLDTTKLIY